jgi:hypothetical protein
VLIPMGMQAITWFFPETKRLDEVVGDQKHIWHHGSLEYAVICLPHSSPGSRWLNEEANRKLLRAALQLFSELWTASSQ